MFLPSLIRVCFTSPYANFAVLKFLKLQLSLASYRSRSLRFRITLFHKSEISPLEICFQLGQSQITLCFNLFLPSLIRVCFTSPYANFAVLKFLKLQLSLASYRSRSLRFRITLFHKSEISPLEICFQLGQSQITLCFNLFLPSLIRVCFTSPYGNFAVLKFLKLQLSLASCRSRSLRFRTSLFHKSEISQKKKTHSKCRLGKTSNNVY